MEISAPPLTAGGFIAQTRRMPAACLYCAATATTKEHPLTEAVGGRLWARILCTYHNGLVNARADEKLNKNFAPLVTMLQVRRQRGETGAEFATVDEFGKPAIVVAEGFVKEKSLEILEKDERGRIVRAVGDLAVLGRLPPQAFSSQGPGHVIAAVSNPTVRFEVGFDNSLTGAILKIALHFFAGFVGDVPADVASELLPFIIGDADPSGAYVRTPFLRPEVFPDSWPARHEISCYPDGEHVLVTVLLFSAYALCCRLPLRMEGLTGVRYIQSLQESDPILVDQIERPLKLDWNDRPGLHDTESYYTPIKQRLSRIHNAGSEQAIRARCKRAATNANSMSSNFGNIWERYATQLSLECFSTEEIRRIVAIGQHLQREARDPWDVPVSFESPPD